MSIRRKLLSLEAALALLVVAPAFAQEGATPAAPPAAAPPAAAPPAAAPAGRPPAEVQPPERRRGARRLANVRNKKRKHNPNAAVATYPGFRLASGGNTEVYLEISKKTEITEHKAQGRVTYRIKGAEAPIRTNRLPLLTGFFRTAVSRIQLVEVDSEDLDLVIELRTPSQVTHKIVESEGGVVLQVSFPPVSDFLAGSQPAASPAAEEPARTRPTSTTKLKGPQTESPY